MRDLAADRPSTTKPRLSWSEPGSAVPSPRKARERSALTGWVKRRTSPIRSEPTCWARHPLGADFGLCEGRLGPKGRPVGFWTSAWPLSAGETLLHSRGAVDPWWEGGARWRMRIHGMIEATAPSKQAPPTAESPARRITRCLPLCFGRQPSRQLEQATEWGLHQRKCRPDRGRYYRP